MEYSKRPCFRNGEDEDFCGAMKVLEEKRTSDTSEDFILPDYLPDIKKIVAVFPCATVKGRFLGSGILEYDGEVTYRVLYIAEDGKMKSVSFLTGFDDKIGNEELDEHCVDSVIPLCENLSVRMLNPRKINIRSSNGVNVWVYKRHCHLPELYGARTGDDENKLECKVMTVEGMNVLSLRENGLTLSEDFSFEAAMPTASDIVFSRAVLYPQDCRLADGEVQIRGVAEVYCLLTAEGKEGEKEELIPFVRNLSFTQTLKNESIHEGGYQSCYLAPEGFETRLREDEFGQKRVVEFDMTYAADLAVYYPKEVAVMTDGYSVEKETDLTTSEKCFYTVASPLKGGFSVNETVTLDLPEEGGYTLADAFLQPELRLQKEESDKETLIGSCTVNLLLRDSAGALDTRRAAIPLRFKTDIPYSGKGQAEVCVRAYGGRYRLDKNKLTCDMEIAFTGTLQKCQPVSTVDALRILPEDRQKVGKRGSILLYYPEKGENVFDIAKKYGVRSSALGTEKELQPGKALFIRCK